MPHFFLVQGSLGAGKTLIASILAHHWAIKAGGIRLFANYDLRGATPLDSAERWIEIADARGSICVWDEAQTQFDRRLWTRNTFPTQVLNMTRKLRCIHVFVNPVGANLDSRILDLIEIMIHVSKRQGRYIALDIYEWQDKRYGEWGRPIKRAIMPWRVVRRIWELDLYDTDQLVYPFPQPKTEQAQISLLKRIIETQQAAALRERSGVALEGDQGGWLQASQHHVERRRERERQAAGT
ncbi:MAG: hypothetical protein K6T57_15685 [Thermaceae bacterium]|nr:hypothetical protein [Thermaceae bacterium]